MARTTQVLVTGHYMGALRPGVHYIEVKRDWSNLEEVFEQVRDRRLCEELAENAHRDLVRSGRHSYREFVRQVLEPVERSAPPLSQRHRVTLGVLDAIDSQRHRVSQAWLLAEGTRRVVLGTRRRLRDLRRAR
jgi:hypothetical protein